MQKYLGTLSVVVTVLLGTVPMLLEDRLRILGLILVVLGAVLVYLTFRKESAQSEVLRFRRPKQQNKIDEYMVKLFQGSGATLVLTRDMTWAENTATLKDLLLAKARKKELTVIMESKTAFGTELIQAGATVFYYATLGISGVQSRFTIVDHKSAGAEVAIGRTSNRIHTIERFGPMDPPLALALDLEKIVRATMTPASA